MKNFFLSLLVAASLLPMAASAAASTPPCPKIYNTYFFDNCLDDTWSRTTDGLVYDIGIGMGFASIGFIILGFLNIFRPETRKKFWGGAIAAVSVVIIVFTPIVKVVFNSVYSQMNMCKYIDWEIPESQRIVPYSKFSDLTQDQKDRVSLRMGLIEQYDPPRINSYLHNPDGDEKIRQLQNSTEPVCM